MMYSYPFFTFPSFKKVPNYSSVVPNIAPPKVSAPKMATPKMATSKVSAPKVSTPKMPTPKMATPKVSTPKMATPKINQPSNFPGSSGFSEHSKYSSLTRNSVDRSFYTNPFNSLSLPSANYNSKNATYNFSKKYSNLSNSTKSFYSETKKKDNDKKSVSFQNPISNLLSGFFNQDDRGDDEQYFEILGLKLYFDDILLICLIFFLYKEDVKDQYLFVALILLLLS